MKCLATFWIHIELSLQHGVRSTQDSAAMLLPRHLCRAFPQRGCPKEVLTPNILPALKTLATKAWGGFAMNGRRYNSHCSSRRRPGDLSHDPNVLSTPVPNLGPGATSLYLTMIYDPSYCEFPKHRV